jgi:hypothetical protein
MAFMRFRLRTLLIVLAVAYGMFQVYALWYSRYEILDWTARNVLAFRPP